MSTDEWIKKVWYVYTMEYYSALEKGDILPPAATWMDLCCMKLVRQILFDSKLMNKMKKKKQTHKQEREQTRGYQLGEGKREWLHRDKGF